MRRAAILLALLLLGCGRVRRFKVPGWLEVSGGNLCPHASASQACPAWDRSCFVLNRGKYERCR